MLARLPELEEAARQLQNASPDTDACAGELRGLSQDLRRAAVLIEHGYALELGWARILAAATAEYRPDGEPASLTPQTSVSMEG